MAVKLFRPIGAVSRWVARLLGPPVRLVVHVVMLPVDLVFLVLDAFWLNVRKTGWFGTDCRGRDSFPGGPCPPARKYTNKFLFRLVCPEMARSRREPRPVCRAGEKPAVRLVRGSFVVFAVGFIGLLGAWGVLRAWSQREGALVPEDATQRVLAERIAQGDAAFSGGKYGQALSSYRSALRLTPGDMELRYKAGLCYDELAEAESAARYFAGAAQGGPTLTFANNGSATDPTFTGDTITRSSGSWATDGFAASDAITVIGTTSNNTTTDAAYTIGSISAAGRVLTLDTSDTLVNEDAWGDALLVAKTVPAGEPAVSLKGEDGHPPAVRRMALRMYERGVVRAAGGYARRAIALGVEDGPIHAILADSYLWRDDIEGAAPHIAAALQANPESSIVRAAQAHSLAIAGESERAVEILDTVADDPSVALLAGLYKLDLLRKAGRADEELMQMQALAGQFPDMPWLSIRLVETRLVGGQMAEAMREAERLRRELRDDPEAKLQLAATLSRYGRDSLAVQIAQECADDNDRFRAQANVFIGEVFLRRGMFEHARAYGERALAEQPSYAPALLLAGRAALSTGDADTAGVYLGAAVEAAPENSAVWHSLGLLHATVRDLVAAEESLQKACELSPENGSMRQQYGMVLLGAGKKEEAQGEFLKAVELMEQPMTAYTSLGMLAQQADSEEAARYYLAAIQAAPKEAAIAANNLAELILSSLAPGDDASLAVALAYSAYVRTIGTQYEQSIADTLAKALRAAGLSAEDLGVELPPSTQDATGGGPSASGSAVGAPADSDEAAQPGAREGSAGGASGD